MSTSVLNTQGFGAEDLQPPSDTWPAGGQQERSQVLASLGAALGRKRN